MSVAYRAVQWNAFKWRYDLVVAIGSVAFVGVFVAATLLPRADVDRPALAVVLIRATAVLAFSLLHVVLMIGPLARLDRRFLPLLYNRRHLGVTTFLVSLVHAVIVLGYYHGFGTIGPVSSLLSSNVQYRSIAAFPFETLGLIALLILFLMAATSHDFWLKNLSPAVWKGLHMLVYPAYVLLVLHVALGALWSERHPAYVILLTSGVVLVSGLHIAAAWAGRTGMTASASDWIDVDGATSIAEGKARRITLPDGTRAAVFRVGATLHAIGDACAHQGGPLSEGRIIDGCVTCPWHGYQYRAQDGCAPAPFTEKLPTYELRIHGGRVQVRSTPQAAGTPTGFMLQPSEVSNV